MAEAARDAWQQQIRESYQQGPGLSADEARILYVLKAADAAVKLRAKGVNPHATLESWALETVETSKGPMTRLKAFGALDSAEEVFNATWDEAVAHVESTSGEG